MVLLSVSLFHESFVIIIHGILVKSHKQLNVFPTLKRPIALEISLISRL